MDPVLDALRARTPVPRRMAIVVAHPDDETLAAGASLPLMPGLLLVHVTDGAPRALPDAAETGHATPRAYAAARRAELGQALALAGVEPDCVELDVADQEASLGMPGIAPRLRALFAEHGTEAVLTHAYEGGHPDHDATSLCVHLATRDGGPAVYEFAGYHAAPDGSLITGQFLPGPPATVVELTGAEAARKRAMLACFATQRRILTCFGVREEAFRPAPAYDFTAPPHAGRLNYEHWGWSMTGARWRDLAAEALRCA